MLLETRWECHNAALFNMCSDFERLEPFDEFQSFGIVEVLRRGEKMKTNDKSKEQLIEEIHQLTVKVAELEKSKMELKQVERTLGEERNLLRTLIDNVPDHIYAKDTKCRYFVSNRAHKRFLNVETEEDIIGKSVFDLYSQEMAEHYYADD